MSRQKDIRFAFFGTPEIAVAVLNELEAAGLLPVAVITQPDAPKGREQVMTPPPVKEWALERDVDVLQPEKLDDAFIADLSNSEWDVFIVAAYGKILPKSLIEIPHKGTVNVHPSLLPRLRGASPIRSAILTDEKVTGITIIQIDEEMDHGPIIAQARIEIEDWPPRATVLEGVLSHEGGKLLAEILPDWVAGKIDAQPQDHDQATYCKKIRKEDGLVSLFDDPYQNILKIRGLEGWPGTYTFFERNGETIRVAIIDAHIDERGALVIDTVKPEGKREMPYEDFLCSGAIPTSRA